MLLLCGWVLGSVNRVVASSGEISHTTSWIGVISIVRIVRVR